MSKEKTSKSPAVANGAPLASRLEELKRKHFTPEGKAERVARSLAALQGLTPIPLTREQWKIIAEDADVEEQ